MQRKLCVTHNVSIENRFMANNRQQLVEELKALLEQDVTTVKEQVDHLKTQFYRAAAETADQTQEAAEQVADQASQVVDELEEQFKALLNEYKAKRAAVAEQMAKEENTCGRGDGCRYDQPPTHARAAGRVEKNRRCAR